MGEQLVTKMVTAQQAAGKAKQEAMARSRLRERFLEVSVNDRILQ
jgi:hypothetical protein